MKKVGKNDSEMRGSFNQKVEKIKEKETGKIRKDKTYFPHHAIN